MARLIAILLLDSELRKELQGIVNRPKATKREVRRASIILRRAEGLSQPQTAEAVGVNRPVVAKWEKRFRQQGVAGLAEARRSGRKPSVPDAVRRQIIDEVTRPPHGRTRWSSRSMAKSKGVSAHTVQRLWRANELKPHVTRTFKLSRDKHFEAKFWDVIALTSIRRTGRWCCAVTRRASARPWSELNPAYPWASATSRPPPTTTSGTARSRFSRR